MFVGRLSALALATLSLASKEPDTDSYYSYSDTDSYYSYSAVEDACSPGCGRGFRDDGECDATCNNVQCDFDGADCFFDFGECYTATDGSDYRGAVSETVDNLTCQQWSEQHPQTHTNTHTNFPKAALGGHNHCRNPDHDTQPWCFTRDPEVRWDYCNLQAPPQPACIKLPSSQGRSSPPWPPSQPRANPHSFSVEAAGCAEVNSERLLMPEHVVTDNWNGGFYIEVWVDGWESDKARSAIAKGSVQHPTRCHPTPTPPHPTPG